MEPDERHAPAARVRTYMSSTPQATEALGEALGRLIEHETVIALDGELGAGKTCFVRGLARGLEVADVVSSPTYSLLQSYAGRLALHHFDAWMEGRERAFLMDGGLEWMFAGGVSVIEWAARVHDVLPQERLCVLLEHRGPQARRVELRVAGSGASATRLEHIVGTLAPIVGLVVLTGLEGD